jgi:hypothetical protein
LKGSLYCQATCKITLKRRQSNLLLFH